jgi:hypothetical protein
MARVVVPTAVVVTWAARWAKPAQLEASRDVEALKESGDTGVVLG